MTTSIKKFHRNRIWQSGTSPNLTVHRLEIDTNSADWKAVKPNIRIFIESALAQYWPAIGKNKEREMTQWGVSRLTNKSANIAKVHNNELDDQSEFDSPSSIHPQNHYTPIETTSEPDYSTLSEDTTEVLNQLEQASGNELRNLIIHAEGLQFEGENRNRLVYFLKSYIENKRDSNNRDELLAIPTAIRKCIALLDFNDFDWVATLLESGHRTHPSLEGELAIAKMVYRRYSATPPLKPDPHPQLSNNLAEIARLYLEPRLFTRPRHSTIAMLSSQALIVMYSESAKSVIEKVNHLPYSWFREQLKDRMERLLGEINPESEQYQNIRTFVDLITAP